MDSAYGMVVDAHGPFSLRRNDMFLYNESHINERLGNLNSTHFMFGDSAYGFDTRCTSYRQINNLEGHERAFWKDWNTAMKKAMISIEWNYACLANHFNYLRNIKK